MVRDWWIVAVVLGSLLGTSDATSKEKELISHLLNGYDNIGRMGPLGRPVKQSTDQVVIYYGLSMIQILGLDERNQVLTVNVWGNYQWKDEFLTWDPLDYDNISSISVPSRAIWIPDIKLYNYADERLSELRETLAVVSSDGGVLWIPQAIYKSSCSIDITYFPFDEQTCKMKFGSWTYDGYKLDVQFGFANNTGFDFADYVESNEWDIVRHVTRRYIKYYPCCPTPYPDLKFFLHLKRRVAFYNYILILPCVLLSSLTLVLFWLPPESPSKMQLGMNIFVAFFVLLLLLAESTPPAASNIPLIGAYYCLNMVLITLSTFLSVIVVNLYFHGNRTRVPRLLKTLMIDCIARILCMRSFVLDLNAEEKLIEKQKLEKKCRETIENSHAKKKIYNDKIPVNENRKLNGNLTSVPCNVNWNTVDGPTTNLNWNHVTPDVTAPSMKMYSDVPPPAPSVGITYGDNTPNVRMAYNDNTPNVRMTYNDNTPNVRMAYNDNVPNVRMRFDNGQNVHMTYNDVPQYTKPPPLLKNSNENLPYTDHKLLYRNDRLAYSNDGLAYDKPRARYVMPLHDDMTYTVSRESVTSGGEEKVYSVLERLDTEVTDIRSHVKFLTDRISNREVQNKIGKEWKGVALVLDRIFFFVYLTAILISIGTLFLMQPGTSEAEMTQDNVT